ncbi:hypothetical protein [Corynebacterium heidelbergense]|uniref:Phage gp6-like head-tail connector protein n=1 Tax=Corynebacterium heidelbergense TaxID=2055947 RepID=A0A364VC68_9CORY|nr:hypothetical protein [Corynebacterium heidelbergense]RAV34252.1 hypothetical protein CWC39_04165 [Corynebacterium heidelbergense]WCZ36976.1 hypothetical protein CHEID_07215 [Corynebacterium heidelbergense]
MTAPQDRIRLVDLADLERSLTSDSGPIDHGLAAWVIEVVSAAALDITRRDWASSMDVPPGAMAVLALACRRLYTNPDRYTREAEGDYSYGLDPSVTSADIFTASERATLREYRGARRSTGLGTVSTYRGDLGTTGTRYVPDGTEFRFPWYAEGE